MRRISITPLAALAACAPSPQEAVMRTPTPVPTQSVPVSGATYQAKGRATPAADSHAAAQGRRTLSTAFVMVGPDGYLTVELGSGRVLVLRDVAMRRDDYCGSLATGERYCGGYAEVAAARPGGGPAPAGAATPSIDPAGPERSAPRRP